VSLVLAVVEPRRRHGEAAGGEPTRDHERQRADPSLRSVAGERRVERGANLGG